jgi:hypothetical protein
VTVFFVFHLRAVFLMISLSYWSYKHREDGIFEGITFREFLIFWRSRPAFGIPVGSWSARRAKVVASFCR